MRIAIYGAGSLGTIVGAYLTAKDFAVDLITRNVNHVAALREHGARITGKVELTVPVTALLPEQMTGKYDIVFLLTKQLENEQVVRFLKPFIADAGVLCTMQNGLPEPALAEVLGAQAVLGCAIGWGATLLEPGIVEMTSGPDTFVFNLGMLPSGNAQSLQVVASVLSRIGTVVVEHNFLGARWAKLLVNASFSGMATVLGCTFGQVVSDKRSRRYAQCIVKECIETARALGISIEPIQGKDIVRLFDYHNAVKRWISFVLMPLAMRKHRTLKPSMLQDIEKGKPCEVDAINGIVSTQARIAGIATPVNDRVVQAIHAIERGEISPGLSNLQLFDDLEGL